MANRLADATSPYLLQHADNPVDWYPWGEEARRAAQDADRPILLSVGYASCHWCHVMAHESFEDPETADLMNRLFVNVKVDREERPDVDAIYMDAVQAMTGRGGWPMTVFLTPAGHPFYAGTYFPRESLQGMPSFRQILVAVAEAWNERRDEVTEQAERLTETVSRRLPSTAELPGRQELAEAYSSLRRQFDPTHGGFGGAPKFPQTPVLEFLLRAAAREWAPEASDMVLRTLGAMAAGGIYDHLGGGFARYAVDSAWRIPHFEKMLYDNAQLARLYLRAWQVLGVERLRVVSEETLDYLLRHLRHGEGGFFSAEDADSEGEEGKFYLFSAEEFRQTVGSDHEVAAEYFGVTEQGDLQGQNVLREARPIHELAERHGASLADAQQAIGRAKARLLEARSRRVRPGLDDKVVAAWNGLAIRALAEAGAVLDDERYLEAARACARFVLSALRRSDGRLLRSWRDGRPANVPAFCDDYASLALGLLTLYQATAEVEWFQMSEGLLGEMVELFSDPDGGFFTTGLDAERLVTRPKDLMDNPMPSANSLAAEALLISALLTGDAERRRLVDGVFGAGGKLLSAYPSAAGHLLAILDTLVAGPSEVAIIGPEPERRELEAVIWEAFRPGCVVAASPEKGESIVPLLEGRGDGDGRALAYVCRNFVCDRPVTEPDALRNQLALR